MVNAFTSVPGRLIRNRWQGVLPSSRSSVTTCQLDVDGLGENGHSSPKSSRRQFLASSVVAATTFTAGNPTAMAEDGPEATTMKDGEGVTLYKTPSGLKYIELEPGSATSKSPRYGQLCIISFKAYLKLPNAKDKEQFDSTNNYIVKHGNGRMIPGLDEGLHTMKVGGLRRLIIPPKLGFVTSGLGPLPEYPWNRWKLNSLLEDMITQRGGNLVYDVRLVKVIDDEADQGYYDDVELSAEELEEIQNKLTRRQGVLP